MERPVTLCMMTPSNPCGYVWIFTISVDVCGFFFTTLRTEFKGVQMDNSVDKCEFLWIAVGVSKVHVQLFSVDVN